MFYRKNFAFCFILCAIFCTTAVLSEDCDKSKCKGPINYYKGLKCKPIYKNNDDCCATSYDCSHIHAKKSPDKCYMNGHEYDYDEELRDEDKPSACDICVCKKNHDDGTYHWTCAVFSCITPEIKEGCWATQDLNSCCNYEEVCPEDGKEVATCEFNGETYKEGQRFYPDGLTCQCLKGYKGENVAPFCREAFCGVELRNSMEINRNCTPVYADWQSPSKNCPYQFRCPNENSKMERTATGEIFNDDENNDGTKCQFGNVTMRMGDELKLMPDHDNGLSCAKCTCEVPPVPTCRECSN